jgi:predicted ribosomally synthesized peptide with SipW-like signal peptide
MKRIALSLMTIAAVAVMATSATGAYFSDSADVSDNTFTAGTLDLKVNGADSASQVYKFNNLKPGAWDLTGQAILKNTGSVEGHAWLEIVNVRNTGELGSLVKASFQENDQDWTRFGGTTSINASEGQKVDLFDLAPGASEPLVVYAVWPNGTPATDNPAQGDSVTFDVIFHLDQK